MGFKNVAEITNSFELISGFRKTPTAAATVNVGFDFSMSSGYPSPNYYASAPAEARYMSHSRNGGIYHGKNVNADQSKFLSEIELVFTTASFARMQMILLDYLLYYPFIDEGTTDEQPMLNDETLQRYTDGEGVMMMAVSVAAASGGQSFKIKYTNSKGESGRVTPNIFMHTSSTFTGSTISSSGNTSNTGSCLFLPLQAGDTGVRYVESITMNGVDVGLFSLVLVKPLFSYFLGDFRCVTHKHTVIDNGFAMPKIENDAYLNYLAVSSGNFSGQALMGTHKFIIKQE